MIAQSGPGALPQPLDAQAQEGLRREEQRSRLQQRELQPTADALRPAPRAADTDDKLPVESPCFPIREIEFTGPPLERLRLERLVQPFVDQCVGVRGLAQIAARIDQALVTMGYATSRVSLPAQNLQSGHLRIRLHVGRISAIRMVAVGNQPDAQWGTWRNAFPVASGDVLDIRAIEQGLEQMKRLPSQNVATRLEPGDEPDTSVLVIERKPASLSDRVRGGITLDNSGNKILGRSQLSTNLALDNPTGLNDLLAFNLASNLEHVSDRHRSQSAGVLYSIPWGYNTLSLSASHSRFAQNVQGTTVQFLSSGQSDNAEARLHRTLWRSSASKLGAYAAVSIRRAESYIDDVELLVQRRRTTALDVGFDFKHLFARSSLDLNVGYKRGVPWGGAQDDLPDAARGGLTVRPRIWSLGAAFNGALRDAAGGAQPINFNSALRVQYTGQRTLAIDQIAIGGRYSVRGFNGDTVLLAESGVIWRNELITPLAVPKLPPANAYLALDYGHVWGPSDVALVGQSLAGVAVGVRGRASRFAYDLGLGAPLYRPDGFRSRHVSLYTALTFAF